MDYQTYQKLEALELQAWTLVCAINRLVELRGARDEKTFRAHRHAYSRFQRRQDKLFNYQPQVINNIDGKYYECECSECDALDCSSCGVISFQPGGFAPSPSQPSGALG